MRLEFGLAAQANTLAEVKTKLESKIAEYIEDINEEKDDFQKQYLLNRKGRGDGFSFIMLHAY